MRVVAVAAVAENGVIGQDGEVPWSVPEDRRQYRDRVEDSPVILGRKTFDSMRDDLPGTTQLVLSNQDLSYPDPTVTVLHSVDAALDHLEAMGASEAYVLGGASIYEAFLPSLDAMYLSRIPATPPGDVTFPEFDRCEWSLIETQDYETFTIEHWEHTHSSTR